MCVHHSGLLTDNLGQPLKSVDFIDEENDTCDYFELNNDTTWTANSTDLIALTLNICDLINKQADHVMLLNKIAGMNKVDIIMLQETWITQTNSHLVNIPGYKHYCAFRSGHKGGGVSILISKELTSQKVDDLCKKENYIESIFIEIKMQSTNVLVGSMYRPPNTDEKLFNQ